MAGQAGVLFGWGPDRFWGATPAELAALVAAEGELGPLFELIERAAAGRLSLAEIATLFWHVVVERDDALTRERIGEAILEAGLAAVTPALRVLISQILQGR